MKKFMIVVLAIVGAAELYHVAKKVFVVQTQNWTMGPHSQLVRGVYVGIRPIGF